MIELIIYWKDKTKARTIQRDVKDFDTAFNILSVTLTNGANFDVQMSEINYISIHLY